MEVMVTHTPLRILVIGSGGREHALIKAFQQSSLCKEVIAAPGNGGIQTDARVFDVPLHDLLGLVSLAEAEKVDLVVVGPELPLCLGIADSLRKRGIPVFGPGAAGAKLEGSKVYTKEFLFRNKIPTAKSSAFDDVEKAVEYLETLNFPVVIKADGLAGGKGVIIANDRIDAERALRLIGEERVFGESGDLFLVEEFLEGEEVSVHILISDDDYFVLPTSQDHKRIGEGDTGPNTGGMGAYAPADVATPEILQQIEKEIVKPVVSALKKEGISYRGVLYAGLMLTAQGPKVLEFNVRFGDPETQVLLPLMETDPLTIFHAVANGRLGEITPKCKPGYAMTVVLAAEGYPEKPLTGAVVTLPKSQHDNATLYHAGTRLDQQSQNIHVSGGRVFNCTGYGDSLAEAAKHAYSLVDHVNFSGKQYRRDIGHRELKRSAKS
jgi:phosphoribosylamine--glycine ligase